MHNGVHVKLLTKMINAISYHFTYARSNGIIAIRLISNVPFHCNIWHCYNTKFVRNSYRAILNINQKTADFYASSYFYKYA